MTRLQINVQVKQPTFEQMKWIQDQTGESQAVILVRLIAQEYTRLKVRQGNSELIHTAVMRMANDDFEIRDGHVLIELKEPKPE